MLFFVIEGFGANAVAVYRRFGERGRLMPDGLRFLDSWLTADTRRCFQLVECEDVTLIQRWVAQWSDLISFEIVPVVAGGTAAAALADDAL